MTRIKTFNEFLNESEDYDNVPGMGNVMLPGSGKDGSGDRFDNDSVIPANAGLNRKMGRYQMKKLQSMDNFIKNSLQESKTDIATELTSDKWKKHLALTYTEVKVDADGDNYKIYLKGKAGWKLAFDIKGDRVEFERLKDDKSQKAPFYLSTPQAEIYSYLETKGYKMKGFRD